MDKAPVLSTPAAQVVDEVPSPPRRSKFNLRFHPAIVVVAAVCAVLVHGAMRSGLAGDVFYEVSAGRWMLAHHAIARSDVFSYTIYGHPWLDEEWGFQVLLAWTVAHIGTVSYWLVSGGACCAALLLSVGRWRLSGTGWLWTATLSVLGGFGMYEVVTPRPQDISYMLFAAMLLIVTLARRRAAWLWAAPFLLALWANLHGSFLLGLGILLLELLWSLVPKASGRMKAATPLPTKPVALSFVGSVFATLLNPHGPHLLSYAYHVSTASQLTSLIEEWQSPDFHSLFYLGVIVGPVLFMVALLLFSDVVLAFDDVVIAGVMFLATLHAIRFMPYLVLIMCSVLSRWVLIKKESVRPTVLSLPLAAVACVAFVAGPHVASGDVQRGKTAMDNPVMATAYLQQQSGRVFTTYWWDDYLIYKGIPVFVDGRTDLYFGTGVLTTYENVSNVTVDPDPVFQKWGVQWVMWDKGTSLAVYLSHDPAWQQVYQAGDAVVFEHVGSW